MNLGHSESIHVVIPAPTSEPLEPQKVFCYWTSIDAWKIRREKQAVYIRKS